jgi:hypothetical protein
MLLRVFQSNRRQTFIHDSTVLCFDDGMRASDQAGTRADWWVAAAQRISARGLRGWSTRAQRDERHAKNVRTAVVVSLFFLLLGAAVVVGGRAVIEPLLSSLTDAPEARRVGEIILTMRDGTYCRHLAFDNTTGQIAERSIEQCANELGRKRSRDTIGFAWGRH